MIYRRSPAATVLQYSALFALMFFLAFPLLWMLSTSFKAPRELVALIPSLIPVNPTIDNYFTAFREQDLVRSATNSLQLSFGSAILTVLVALPAAYGLARHATVLRRLTMSWILVSQIFPLILIIIPLFLILKTLHLLDSLTGLLVVYLVWSLPFTLWMLQSYVKAIPIELEEAASIDGAGRVRILRSIVLPLLAPGLVVAALFAFISAWNEFFFALVVLQSAELYTLPLTLARFIGSEGVVRLGPLAAASFIATLPSLVFFSFIQRHLRSGLLTGGVKG
ncbi:MAG TPA: carbohydrate ABC transporter permease [Candidatus Limnocylindria bacterium]|jgi:multiple sugar transport system permease protein|nr:carbohydrate ABC transporter permease [Candidatus Limnocylindria bacterium]